MLPDFWRNSNETNPAYTFISSAIDWVRGNSADGYQQITQEEAKEMMDAQEVIILDVREQDEYDSGHIPGAVLLPVGSIDEDTAAEVIPEMDSTVLVYCRSGNRSKTASSALAELGYTNIYEFGGINTGPMRRSRRLEIGSLSTCEACKIYIADTKNTRDAPKGASRCSFSDDSSSRLPQPVFELVQGDDLPVAFLFISRACSLQA